MRMDTTAGSRSKSVAWIVGVLTAVAVGIFAMAAPASAQANQPAKVTPTCPPPYGCTTSSTTPTKAITCRMNLHTGPRGITVTIACTNVEAGTSVRVLWDGQVVAMGTMASGDGGVAPAAVGAGQVFDRPEAVDARDQTIPESHINYPAPNLPNGTYDVVIAGDSFSAPVGPFTLTGGGVVGTTNPAGNGSSLARTGITVLLWVLVAVSIVGIGVVVSRSNRRRHHPYG